MASLEDYPDPGDYESYVERFGHDASGSRRKLRPEAYEELRDEYERLLRRMDPHDIQLDEWKRLDELRFLVILEESEDEES